jgi:hypothetical protein
VNRSWVGKIECCELNLTLVRFVRLSGAYGFVAARLIRLLAE